MRLKSYFADTVEAAVSLAGRELGPEAMLVYSREALPEARYLGVYEVVFAVPPAAAEAGASTPPAEHQPEPTARATGRPVAATHPEVELADLRRELFFVREQLQRMAGAVTRNRIAARQCNMESAPWMGLLDQLLAADLSPEIVDRIAERLLRSFPPEDSPNAKCSARDVWLAVREELGMQFSVDPSLASSETTPRVVVFVGPPGSGKTTALVKIAATYGLRARRPVQMLSIDMYRIGAAEQLRSFAAILGVGFQAYDTVVGLTQALEEHRQKELILVDTPGHSVTDIDAATDLAAFLETRREIDVHLTLMATAKSADLANAMNRYERFRPNKLLFTRMDETSSPGSILNEAIRTGKPLSFLTNGQRIPEDLMEASKDNLLDLVLAAESRDAIGQPVDSVRPPNMLRKDRMASKAAA